MTRGRQPTTVPPLLALLPARAGVCGYDGPEEAGVEEDLWESDDSQAEGAEDDSEEWTTDSGEGGEGDGSMPSH